mgnify:CR=1 FL=1
MVCRAGDWFRQALKDFEHARRSLEMGDFEWACFAAHQAAEKAIKALYQKLGIEVWGRSISRMLANLPEKYRPSTDLIDHAKRIDRHYIPSRYPNVHSEGAPLDYYTREDALEAIKYAEEIIEFCRSKIF